MFRVKKLDLETGEIPVIVLNKRDCLQLNMNMGDRALVRWNGKEIIAIIDVAEKLVGPGEVGVSVEIWKGNSLPEFVDILPVEKPTSVFFIRKRLHGTPLKPDEIREIIKDLMENRLSRVEASFFVASAYVQRLSFEEEEALTRAIIEAGEVLEWERHPVLDKHSIGGVPGNRVTPILVPIIAAAGYCIPKTSSKAITSPAGTADVVELLADVALSAGEVKRIVEKTNGVMAWGGTLNLAPADDLLLKLRYPLRLDPISFLLASIMAKKSAVGAEKVLIDIPTGAKVKTFEDARELAERFKSLGKKLGIEVRAVVTDGSQPIGRGVGPALEARDVLRVLIGEGPADLREKALMLSGMLLEMAGEKNGYEKAKKILGSGEAYEKFREIIREQRGNPDVKPEDIQLCEQRAEIKAPRKMRVIYDCEVIAKACRIAGNPSVKGAGMYLHYPSEAVVEKGETVVTVFAPDEYRLQQVMKYLEAHPPFLSRKIVIEVL